MLVGLSKPPHRQTYLVVLHGRVDLLLVPLLLPVCRREEEGFLGDVRPPCCHHCPHGAKLDLPSSQGGLASLACPRLCRPLVGTGEDDTICTIPASVRRCLHNVCGDLGVHQTRGLPNLPHLLNKVMLADDTVTDTRSQSE